MRLSEAIDLLDNPKLRAAIPARPQRWADLGCGDGLFTEALARFLPAGSSLYGVDLRPTLHSANVGEVNLIPVKTDFINVPLPLDDLDGVLMANSFHYVKEKQAFLHKLKSAVLKPGAPLVIVEYDTDKPVQTWVPYPVSFNTLKTLVPKAEKLGEMPSRFGGTMYSAIALV
ncbi:MAG: class I SAM-dependent methyltransferase [Bacteroidetes bacterium]|nr:class I SAM-dependent methyltransferase [Bacteroidota bacterium]